MAEGEYVVLEERGDWQKFKSGSIDPWWEIIHKICLLSINVRDCLTEPLDFKRLKFKFKQESFNYRIREPVLLKFIDGG